MMEYPKGLGQVAKTDIDEARILKEYLTEPRDNSSIKLRLFVVEDLSRDVIETLGSHFNIDPSFFREHLVDYIWYNISKSFRELSW